MFALALRSDANYTSLSSKRKTRGSLAAPIHKNFSYLGHTKEPLSMNTLVKFLETHGIAPVTHFHQPVMTVAEAEQHLPSLPGTMTKNLFLRDNKGRRHFLVTVPHTVTVDLTALG